MYLVTPRPARKGHLFFSLSVSLPSTPTRSRLGGLLQLTLTGFYGVSISACSSRAGRAHIATVATRTRGKSATEQLSSLCDVRRGQAEARGASAVTFVSPAKHMVAPPATIPQYRRSSNFHIQVRNK